MDWQDLMMVLGGAVMKEPLRGYYQFHVKQNNCIYPQNMCIYRLQYSLLCKINRVLTLGVPPGVGILTCHHQIPCVSQLNLGVE